MATLSGNAPHFLFSVKDLDKELRVVRFRSHEALSQLFHVSLELACEDAELKFESVVGKSAVLAILGEDENRLIHGVVARFEQGESGTRFTTYYCTLVPRLWQLAQRHGCRIFQESTLPDIVKEVLEGSGFTGDEYRFVLQGKHEKHDYCVQYRESELNFVSRLLEEEGLYYYFEHHEDKHVLVITDGPAAHKDIAGKAEVRYHPTSTQVPAEEYVFQYRYAEQVRSGTATLRDFNFEKPALKLEGQEQADTFKPMEYYDFPGQFSTPEQGKELAKLRLQGFQAERKEGTGESVCRRFVPGFKFSLDRHPRFDRAYLLTRVDQFGQQPQVLEEAASSEGTRYANRFSCIPDDVQFRAPLVTRKPVVEGLQSAIVVGPSGEEIYTDKYGRVKVQFHWDRVGQYDDKSSCFIRVSQLFAGTQWGAVFTPRIGQEVLVDFLEGDPDQPVVVGRLYHGVNLPPYLPDEKTKSTIKTNSSKGGGGYNEVRFEDNKGKEQIFIHAQRRHDLRVGGSEYESVGYERHLTVKKDQLEKVEKDKHLTVEGDHKEEIQGNSNLTVQGDRQVEVAGSDNLTVAGDRMTDVGGDDNLSTGGCLAISVGGDLGLDVGMNADTKAGMKFAVDAGMEVHLKGGMKVIIEGGMQVSLKAAGSFVDIGPGGVSISGPIVNINSGGAAGSGSGASPAGPASPNPPDPPDPPDPADSGKAGKVDQAGKAEKAWEPVETAYTPAAIVLNEAAEDGTPFCEECERARREREGGGS